MPEVKDRTGLVRQIEKAGLNVELTKQPMRGMLTGPGRNAFQLDISRPNTTKGPREVFRIWPGHEGNRVEIVGTNEDLQQAVLMVKEPKRVIEVEVPLWERRGENWRETLARRNSIPLERIVKKNGRWYIQQETPDTKRHYLMGMDERHYFVCQLPRPATTVNDAHRVLKDEKVSETEKKGKVERQGEWFFVKPTASEREAIEKAIKGNRAIVKKKAPIGREFGFNIGRPHTADELVMVAVATGRRQEVTTRHRLQPEVIVRTETVPEIVRTVFIKGKVKHVEHKSVEFLDWVRVYRNTEIRVRPGDTTNGIRWID